MSTLKDVKKGDTVVCTNYRDEPTQYVVTSAGAKWITANGLRYDRTSGAQDNGNGRCYTAEGHAAFVREGEARKVLRDWGIDAWKLPKEKLEAIVTALRPIMEDKS